MTPSKCNCNCEPKCCTEEDCNGQDCKCNNRDEEIEKKTVEFEPEFSITIH